MTTTDRISTVDSQRNTTDRIGQTVVLGNAISGAAFSMQQAFACPGNGAALATALNTVNAVFDSSWSGSANISTSEMHISSQASLAAKPHVIGSAAGNFSCSAAITWGNKFAATGGTIVDHGIYRSHVFTGSGTFQVLFGQSSVDWLIVGGGAGGGAASSAAAAGGGAAGGMKSGTTNLGVGSYAVAVGSGGGPATNGGSSSIASIASVSGGGHGGTSNVDGTSGGSGGGAGGRDADGSSAGGAGTAGEGNSGGGVSGVDGGAAGGGGKATGGAATSGPTGASGGNGVQNDYANGTLTYYAGGGGGGSNNTNHSSGGLGGGGDGGQINTSGNNASSNTGGGGGGAGANGAASGSGANGIVVIRYVRG